jgi:hypothetical protein
VSLSRKKPLVVRAVQFDPHLHPWPEGVIPWSNDGTQPRDMSWGYIDTPEGRGNVIAGDWIITAEDGSRHLHHDTQFRVIQATAEK